VQPPGAIFARDETYNVGEDNGRSGKLDRLFDLLEEILAEGDRLLIFSQFTEMAGLLKGYIQERFGVPTLYLHGGVPPKKRAPWSNSSSAKMARPSSCCRSKRAAPG
jgi:SNF2 family DNA or RNA helicase